MPTPQQLADKYAPILHFHPNESHQCCFPSDAEPAYALIKNNKFREIREPRALDPNTPCYYQYASEVTGPHTLHRIKYWFWYNFNDFPTGPDPFGHHEGDWEHVEVILRELDAGEEVYAYILSNHDSRILLWPEKAKKTATHVHVWVGKGSHAVYPFPDAPLYYFEKFKFKFYDELKDGGPEWQTWQNLKDITQTTFGNFQEGVWGNHPYKVTITFDPGWPFKKQSWEYTSDPPTTPVGKRQYENGLPFYNIKVFTASRDNAGTDAHVDIGLYGDGGTSPELALDNPGEDNFEKGRHDIFFPVGNPGLTAGQYYGKLQQIKIGHDNEGDKPGWFLDRVEVIDMWSKTKYTFACNQWLAKGVGDGKIVRFLKVSAVSTNIILLPSLVGSYRLRKERQSFLYCRA